MDMTSSRGRTRGERRRAGTCLLVLLPSPLLAPAPMAGFASGTVGSSFLTEATGKW